MTQEHTRNPGPRLSRRQAIKVGAGGMALAGAGASPSLAEEARVSKFGVYGGFSREAYDGWVRTSVYVPMRDGVKLAVDIYRPTKSGKLHVGRLPVVWQPKRYQRAIIEPDGSLVTVMSGSPTNLAAEIEHQSAVKLVRHGYVVVSVDRRGSGSSSGVRSEQSDPKDAVDGYDVTEWLAKQSWSTGKIGMFGASYEGEMQLRVAGTAPPHLKAIMPEVSPFDWYWTVAPGGIVRTSQVNFATSLLKQDTDPNNGPVDDDKDRAQLKAALAGHKAGNDYSGPGGKIPFWDSKNPVTGERHWMVRHGGNFAPKAAKSGIAVYHITGWFSNVSVHQLTWMVNLKGTPQKLLIGPWAAGGAVTQDDRALVAVEALRFFDYWLKGVQNGIMAEPAIHSSIPSSHTRDGAPFKGMSAAWPRPDEQRTEFFFQGGSSGTAKSVNDGKLARAKPAKAGKDDLQVRYDCWYKGGCEPAGAGKAPVNHADFDAQGLTYTTEPLDHDVEITGHGQARLWVSSTADDGDFFLKVQDVDPDGASTYIAQGTLRASHRKLGKPPYDYMGLPYNTSREADVAPLRKGEPNEMQFALFPVSYIVRKGHRIRVTITGSDLDTGPSPQVSPAPVITIHRSASHPSSVTLPIIPKRKA